MRTKWNYVAELYKLAHLLKSKLKKELMLASSEGKVNPVLTLHDAYK